MFCQDLESRAALELEGRWMRLQRERLESGWRRAGEVLSSNVKNTSRFDSGRQEVSEEEALWLFDRFVVLWILRVGMRYLTSASQ